MGSTMWAAVAERTGGPEVLSVREVPRPEARTGWTLVRVEGFGLNRSELMTRRGLSPHVRFPRILGIECVGSVAETVTGPAVGAQVAAVMGEMGREFDGGYAQYALLPDELLMELPSVSSLLDWETLAALPETYLTAYGSLRALGVPESGAGGTLLVRGGTSSVGVAALTLAAGRGLRTIATTRDRAKADTLRTAGATHVVLDSGRPGELTERVRALVPTGPEYVLDLVGAPTTVDSLRLAAAGGTVCVSGMLSGEWVIRDFEPVGHIPSGTKLTAFLSSDLAGKAGEDALREIVRGVADGRYKPLVDRVFDLDEIVTAHEYMEADRAVGKVVVVPEVGGER
ncbi:MAG TPA: zinc-binding dehydrogenase [Pseudonocardia sp.]|jgi:NADPH:quinone reductase-like Zn-dependent oxidoreductase